MTKKITEPQRQLLERAAGRPITDAAGIDPSVSQALIKKKLLLRLPAQGKGSRLIVTQAGLAALSAAKTKDKTTTPESPRGRKRSGVEARMSLAVVKGNAIRDIAPEARGGPLAPEVRSPKGKLGALAALLARPEGASVQEMMLATGWQAHSVRGAMSGALKKHLGYAIESERAAAGRVYRIIDDGVP